MSPELWTLRDVYPLAVGGEGRKSISSSRKRTAKNGTATITDENEKMQSFNRVRIPWQILKILI